MNNENQREQRQGGGGGFAVGFLIGALVGGAVAVLVAQENARDLLVGKAREAGNFAKDATGDLRGKVTDVASTWQTNASDLYTRGKEVVDNARSQVHSAVDEGSSTAESMRDDLSRNAKEV